MTSPLRRKLRITAPNQPPTTDFPRPLRCGSSPAFLVPLLLAAMCLGLACLGKSASAESSGSSIKRAHYVIELDDSFVGRSATRPARGARSGMS